MQRPLSLAVGLVAAYVAFLTTCYFAESYGIKRHQVEAGLFILVPLLLLKVIVTPREPGRQVRPAHSYTGFVIVVAVIGCVAYGRALQVGLLSDDFVLRAWAVEGRVGWGGSQFARPVALAVWRIIFQLGAGASVLHALNIGLHLGNVVIGGRIAGLLGLSRTGVAIAALTVLVWPTQVEPVVWAAGVFDVLASSFILLALWICLRAAPLGR